MPEFAFLFPGQGSQQAGMGTEVLRDPDVCESADRCSAAAGIDLVHLLTAADDDELVLTTNAQPALLFMGVALARLLARRGVRPSAAAGHSVGEYTALCVAGAMEPEAAVRLVVERGRAMAGAAPPGTSSMAAVIGLTAEAVEATLARSDDVWPANYNSGNQLVIAGTLDGLDRAKGLLLEAGARRVLPLNVAAAFHTPLMSAAGAGLRRSLDAVAWRAPEVPVVANLTAEPYAGEAAIADVLERQLSSPVRWADCVRRLRSMGCDTFLEVGPKRALTGMMRDLAPEAGAHAVGSPDAVETLSLT